MRYEEYLFLYPPRPEQIIMSGMLGVFEKRRFVAQIKKNGTGSILAVSPKKELYFKTRVGEDHRAWTPTDEIISVFYGLPPRWFYFCFELLHSKTKDIKNTIFIHDILVYGSKYLLGSTYKDRYSLYHQLFPIVERTGQFDIVNDNVLLANNYDIGFEYLFDSLKNTEDEGLVLKNPNAELQICSKEGSNSNWQVKCRR